MNREDKAVILSQYAERIAERYHDLFFETPLGKKIIAQGEVKKYAIEFLLYLTSVYVNRKLSERTILQMVFKNVVMDAFHEFAQRMHDGESRYRAGANVLRLYPMREALEPARENSFSRFIKKEAQEIEDYLADRKRRKGR